MSKTLLDHFMSSHAPQHEKRITQLPPIRCSDALETALHRLAMASDRKVSEYIRLVLEHHVWGHAANLPADEEGVQ